MPHYLLSVIQPDGEPPSPEVLEPIMRDVAAYDAELRASGAWVFNAALHDAASSTVVQLHESGELTMTDGPYLEAKEHVGGLSIIDVPDLDAALEWARKAARASTLPIEVRPFQGDFAG